MVKTTSNKGTLKKITYTMLMAAVVSAGLLSPLHTTPVVAANNVQIAAVQSQFKDVGTSHFAYEAVHWAKKKGIVDGYSDGRFGPNDDVTEGQFAKMITEYFGLKDSGGKLTKTNGGDVWTDAYYNKLAGYGVPLNGYYDNVIRNKVVKRGTVAQTLAYLGGYSMGLEDSINFLLDNKVTVGQNSAHKNDLFKYFGTQNDLSRAQVVTFLYRMNNNDLSKISADAVVMFKNDSGYSLNDSAKIAKNRIDKSLAQGAVSSTPGGSFNQPSKPSIPDSNVEKPNYSMPVSDNAKIVDKTTVDFFSGKISSEVKNMIFDDRNYKVTLAESSSFGKSIQFSNGTTGIGYSIGPKEDLLMFRYVDEDIAIAVINKNYGTKFSKNSFKNAKDGKINNTFSIMSNNNGDGAMVMIKK